MGIKILHKQSRPGQYPGLLQWRVNLLLGLLRGFFLGDLGGLLGLDLAFFSDGLLRLGLFLGLYGKIGIDVNSASVSLPFSFSSARRSLLVSMAAREAVIFSQEAA